MTAKEVLKLALQFVGLDEILSTNIFTANGSVPTTNEDKEVNTLLTCLNFTLENIALDYLPLIANADVNFGYDEVSYSNICARLVNIRRIVDKYGFSQPFKTRANGVTCNIESGKVEYSYLPDVAELSDDVENFGGRVTARTLAFGTAMEYSFLKSLSDEGEIWENRFLDAMEKASQKKKDIVLPQRKWC